MKKRLSKVVRQSLIVLLLCIKFYLRVDVPPPEDREDDPPVEREVVPPPVERMVPPDVERIVPVDEDREVEGELYELVERVVELAGCDTLELLLLTRVADDERDEVELVRVVDTDDDDWRAGVVIDVRVVELPVRVVAAVLFRDAVFALRVEVVVALREEVVPELRVVVDMVRDDVALLLPAAVFLFDVATVLRLDVLVRIFALPKEREDVPCVATVWRVDVPLLRLETSCCAVRVRCPSNARALVTLRDALRVEKERSGCLSA